MDWEFLDFNGYARVTVECLQIYGCAQQLQSCEAPFYITSSLQADEMSSLLQKAGVKLAADSPQLFEGLDADKTIDTLR